MVLAIALILYTGGVGWGLLSGNVPPQRAFLLIALPCLLPLAWCAYGYFKGEDDKDQGLLISAIGWLLILGALITKDLAALNAPAAGTPQDGSSLAPICAVFGVICLISGAVSSWMFWASREERSSAQQRHSTHY